MNINDVAPTQHAEVGVKAAFAKQSKVGGGSFALILDAEDTGYVVKLTRSEANYAALLHFSGTNLHFPKVIKHAVNQVQGDAGPFHAVLVGKLPKVFSPKAIVIANHINAQEIGKHHPYGFPVDGARLYSRGVLNCRHRMLSVDQTACAQGAGSPGFSARGPLVRTPVRTTCRH